jgi:tetratricopeptide (TPR) repeat protein
MVSRKLSSSLAQAVVQMTTVLCSCSVILLAQQTPPRAEVIDDKAPKAIPVDPNTGEPVQRPGPGPSKGPDEDLFDYATLCYTQKDYQIALKPFVEYVRSYPRGRHAADAWFHAGECYMRLSQKDEASQCYNNVLKAFPTSDSVGGAAYRLGALAYNDREFDRAAQLFDTCQKAVALPDIKMAALNNKALAYKMAGDKAKALAAYKAVAAIDKDNPYRESALLEVAAAAAAAGKKDEALTAYKELIALSKDDAVIGDALISAGLIQGEQGKGGEALQNLEHALTLKSLTQEKKGIAVFGLIQAAYSAGDYKKVVETYSANATTLPPDDLRPKQLLIIGMAYKQLQRYRQAVEMFLLLERNHPNEPEAFEGGYQKLLCFFQMNDKDIVSFALAFEERYAKSQKGHEYLMMARLIRADAYFGTADYKLAAEAFSGIDIKKVPAKVRPSMLYKKGFAETEAGNFNDSIATLGAFISEYPKHENIPLAYAQRGIAYKSVRDFPKALADFATITKSFPDHAAAEMAYYQSGLIKADTRETDGMIADFEALVAKFPKSAACAEAWFRIGKGYFDQQTKDSYAKAIKPLHNSINADAAHFLDRCSQILISAQYLREDVEGLGKEIDAYYAAKKDAIISPKILTYLGAKFFERANYKAASTYLNRASTPDQPTGTEALVWNYLGMAELENGRFDKALVALDNYLTQTPEGGGRAKALLSKGRALLGLERFDEAEKCATEGINMGSQGRLRAQLQILEGDIANAHGDSLAKAGDPVLAKKEWQKSAGSYVVISQIFVDPEITPEALSKAIAVLEKMGDNTKAETLRKQLASKYPGYKAKN